MNQPDAATQQFEQLMQRPDIEQATGHYDELFNKIREHLARTFPAILWQ